MVHHSLLSLCVCDETEVQLGQLALVNGVFVAIQCICHCCMWRCKGLWHEILSGMRFCRAAVPRPLKHTQSLAFGTHTLVARHAHCHGPHFARKVACLIPSRHFCVLFVQFCVYVSLCLPRSAACYRRSILHHPVFRAFLRGPCWQLCQLPGRGRLSTAIEVFQSCLFDNRRGDHITPHPCGDSVLCLATVGQASWYGYWLYCPSI